VRDSQKYGLLDGRSHAHALVRAEPVAIHQCHDIVLGPTRFLRGTLFDFFLFFIVQYCRQLNVQFSREYKFSPRRSLYRTMYLFSTVSLAA
jgi:hypothetical protein